MKRSQGLKRSSPEAMGAWRERSKPLKRGAPKRVGIAEAMMADHFRRSVLAYPCWFARHRPGHVCEGRKDPHHLLPQRAIKLHLAGADEETLISVLWDPVNGAPLCRRAHDLVEARVEHIWWEELTPECIDLAVDIGLKGRLLQACPRRPKGEKRRDMLGRFCPDCAGAMAGDSCCTECGAHWGADG